MAISTSILQQPQMIITLEDNAMVADIKKALVMEKAREEYSKGETITCASPEEMQRYFDSL